MDTNKFDESIAGQIVEIYFWKIMNTIYGKITAIYSEDSHESFNGSQTSPILFKKAQKNIVFCLINLINT